jgi:hypothetical protein
MIDERRDVYGLMMERGRCEKVSKSFRKEEKQ